MTQLSCSVGETVQSRREAEQVSVTVSNTTCLSCSGGRWCGPEGSQVGQHSGPSCAVSSPGTGPWGPHCQPWGFCWTSSPATPRQLRSQPAPLGSSPHLGNGMAINRLVTGEWLEGKQCLTGPKPMPSCHRVACCSWRIKVEMATWHNLVFFKRLVVEQPDPGATTDKHAKDTSGRRASPGHSADESVRQCTDSVHPQKTTSVCSC